MTFIRSTKDVDYFTQLIYEALKLIERERQKNKIKENVDEIKIKELFQKRNTPERSRTVLNVKS
jgi:hypothetical protein